MRFLTLDIDYKEWKDKDTGLLMWEFTERGRKKAQKFDDLATLWLNWLSTEGGVQENLVNPMTMGIND